MQHEKKPSLKLSYKKISCLAKSIKATTPDIGSVCPKLFPIWKDFKYVIVSKEAAEEADSYEANPSS